MIMFVYTKNNQVIKDLESDGERLIKVNDDGTYVYTLSSVSNFKFDNQDETYISKKLRF